MGELLGRGALLLRTLQATTGAALNVAVMVKAHRQLNFPPLQVLSRISSQGA